MKQAEITLGNIAKVLRLNKIQGRTETGYHYWLCQFMTSDYKNQHLDTVARRIRFLWGFTTISTCPFEISESRLNDRIKEVAKHYWAIHKQQLELGV